MPEVIINILTDENVRESVEVESLLMQQADVAAPWADDVER
jgi:hypothetical protein